MAETVKTTDHDEIRKFAEKHKARPSRVAGTESGEGKGIIRLNFPGYTGEDGSLEEIEWEEFFEIFEDNNLAMIYDADQESPNFNKFVNR